MLTFVTLNTHLMAVVDGQQSKSCETVHLMADTGPVEVMNLDHGGTSTLIVNKTLVNRPDSGTAEHDVIPAIAVISNLQQ